VAEQRVREPARVVRGRERVWCHPERGAPDVDDGDDCFRAFASFEDALAFSRSAEGAEEPLALVLQREYINET